MLRIFRLLFVISQIDKIFTHITDCTFIKLKEYVLQKKDEIDSHKNIAEILEQQVEQRIEQQAKNGFGLISIRKLLAIINREIKVESEKDQLIKTSLSIPLTKNNVLSLKI